MTDTSLGAIIEQAIRKEEEAYDFYMDLNTRVTDRGVRDTLTYIAGEEKKHREFLVNYRDGRYSASGMPLTGVIDYRIAEYLERPDIKNTLDSKDVYLVASHRELMSHNLYQGLAAQQPEGEAKELLLGMALEELRHKEKMEYLYANTAFPQTSGG